MGILSVITIILLLAKIFGLVAISWLAVFLPLIIGVVIGAITFIIGALAVFKL